MVTLGKKPRRVKAGLATHQRWREPAPPSPDQLAVLVRRMRGTKGKANTNLAATDVVERIRAAARARETVWIEYLNTEGAVTRRLIDPVALSGGSVAAFDHLSKSLKTFVLHRVTDVTPENQLS
jgi:predicted DNA-binding transcriptional regulator YafY